MVDMECLISAQLTSFPSAQFAVFDTQTLRSMLTPFRPFLFILRLLDPLEETVTERAYLLAIVLSKRTDNAIRLHILSTSLTDHFHLKNKMPLIEHLEGDTIHAVQGNERSTRYSIRGTL